MKGLDGSAIKVIAAASMTVDHVGITQVCGPIVSPWLRLAGRIAFPCFAFLVTQGYAHTRDITRYALSLLVLAALSEVPFDLLTQGTAVNWGHQNTVWTLLLGVCAMTTLDTGKLPSWAKGVTLAAAAVLSMTCDYGLAGLALILVFRYMEGLPRYITGACALGQSISGALGFIPVALYNGQRGFIRSGALKYAFYLYYPAHLTVIWAITK